MSPQTSDKNKTVLPQTTQAPQEDSRFPKRKPKTAPSSLPVKTSPKTKTVAKTSSANVVG